MSWCFACEGDLHYTMTTANHGDVIRRFARLKYLVGPDFVIVAGDLTENGTDGTKYWILPSHDNQIHRFHEYYVYPIENLMHIPLKLVPGNHDVAQTWEYPRQTLLRFINSREHGTFDFFHPDNSCYYTFEHKGWRFISCGVFPKNLRWVRDTLSRVTRQQPLVFFFHYSFDGNEDWWTTAQREAFYNEIKNHNVKLIVSGHSHVTMWGARWHGIQTLIAYDLVVVHVDAATNELTIHKFVDA